MQVTAVDPDLAANADLTYALVDSPESEVSVADYLMVEAKTGIIRAKVEFEGLGRCSFIDMYTYRAHFISHCLNVENAK